MDAREIFEFIGQYPELIFLLPVAVVLVGAFLPPYVFILVIVLGFFYALWRVGEL